MMARKVNTTEAPIVFIVDDDVSVRRSTGRFVRSLGPVAGTGLFRFEIWSPGRRLRRLSTAMYAIFLKACGEPESEALLVVRL
jgi:hypothetical protein